VDVTGLYVKSLFDFFTSNVPVLCNKTGKSVEAVGTDAESNFKLVVTLVLVTLSVSVEGLK